MNRDLPGADAAAATREDFVLHGEAAPPRGTPPTRLVRNGFGEPANATEAP